MVAVVLSIVLSVFSRAEDLKQVILDHKDRQEIVTYDYYVPEHPALERMPVLICTGGLPMDEKGYLRSDTHECFGEVWKKFADENHLVIIGLGFLFIPEDWDDRTSYQYAQVWSGKALLEILARLEKEIPIDKEQLYLFGISAGAQFSVRFAQMEPGRVKAVTAHAAGGFDEPQDHIATRFLLTVGEKDNEEFKRLDMAEEFVKLCRAKDIDIRLEIIPGIGHRQTEGQNEMSRIFIHDVLKQVSDDGADADN